MRFTDAFKFVDLVYVMTSGGPAQSSELPTYIAFQRGIREFAIGEAEDVAEVISTTGTESVPVASCNNTCLVTRDFAPLDPGVNENKYYAPGIGLILEIDAEGNRVELTEFSIP